MTEAEVKAPVVEVELEEGAEVDLEVSAALAMRLLVTIPSAMRATLALILAQ